VPGFLDSRRLQRLRAGADPALVYYDDTVLVMESPFGYFVLEDAPQTEPAAHSTHQPKQPWTL